MMQLRLFRNRATVVLLTFVVLAAPEAAAQFGRVRKLPDTVKLEANIPYAGTDNPRQRLNLLLPRTPRNNRPLPVIVYIHGGAWLAGDRAAGHGRLVAYVAGGEYAGVSVGYRLTREAIWPAQIHDCKAAIRWIRANARKYNLDPYKIGVIGDSAGGHLVAMLGTSGGVKALEGNLGPHKSVSSWVQCVVDRFGPSDILAMKDYPSRLNHDAASSPEGKLVGGRVSDKKDVAIAASPITYVSPDDPPFLIIHGNKDVIVPYNQSQRLSAALKKTKVECYFVTVDGAGHGDFRNPEIQKRQQRFFDRHLRGVNTTISEESIPNTGPGKASTLAPPGDVKKDHEAEISPPPPRGFDARRNGIDRGKLEAAAVLAASSEISVVTAHVENSKATPAFAFKNVPPPVHGDAGTDATFRVVDGRRDRTIRLIFLSFDRMTLTLSWIFWADTAAMAAELPTLGFPVDEVSVLGVDVSDCLSS